MTIDLPSLLLGMALAVPLYVLLDHVVLPARQSVFRWRNGAR